MGWDKALDAMMDAARKAHAAALKRTITVLAGDYSDVQGGPDGETPKTGIRVGPMGTPGTLVGTKQTKGITTPGLGPEALLKEVTLTAGDYKAKDPAAEGAFDPWSGTFGEATPGESVKSTLDMVQATPGIRLPGLPVSVKLPPAPAMAAPAITTPTSGPAGAPSQQGLPPMGGLALPGAPTTPAPTKPPKQRPKFGRRPDWDIKFSFLLAFRDIACGSFQTIQGLKIESKPTAVEQVGLNDYNMQLLGAAKYTPVTLKRGFMTANSELLSWMEKTYLSSPPLNREKVDITVRNEAGEAIGTYTLTGAWVSKYEGPEFDAKSGELAVESVEITYDNFTYTPAGATPKPTPPPPTPVTPPPPPPQGDVNFNFDKSNILPPDQPYLDQVAQYLKDNPDKKCTCIGHTDSVGSASYNKGLSLKRANATRDYLIGKGVPPHQVTAEGRGEEEPIASNDTSAGRAQNRRCDIKYS